MLERRRCRRFPLGKTSRVRRFADLVGAQNIPFGLLVLLSLAVPAQAADRFITVASTTSTEQSGLFGHILPKFKEKTGIDVRVIAQGTGQALETGRRGDADVVFVHDAEA